MTPRGDIDALAAPLLHGALSAVSDGPEPDVVLDLGEVAFMDAACLGVIGAVAGSIQAKGGSFALRSPDPRARRLLEVTDLDALIEPGDEEHPRRLTSPVVAATTVSEGSDLLRAALELVTTYAQVAIRGADGVSVAVVRDGRLSTVAVSDETIAQMDRDQYASGEGPCLSAAAEGQAFHVASVADDDRWPAFLGRARAEGIGSILSTPLSIGARSLGSLNVYARAERAFVPDAEAKAAELAAMGSTIVAAARLDLSDEGAAQQLAAALRSRTVIAQAQGVIMARYGVSAEAAFAAMCRGSRRAGVSIRSRAASIVAATDREGLIGEVRG